MSGECVWLWHHFKREMLIVAETQKMHFKQNGWEIKIKKQQYASARERGWEGERERGSAMNSIR